MKINQVTLMQDCKIYDVLLAITYVEKSFTLRNFAYLQAYLIQLLDHESTPPIWCWIGFCKRPDTVYLICAFNNFRLSCHKFGWIIQIDHFMLRGGNS